MNDKKAAYQELEVVGRPASAGYAVQDDAGQLARTARPPEGSLTSAFYRCAEGRA